MGNINKNALNNIYNASKIGLDSIEYLYGKVTDKQIKNELNIYAEKYYDILNESTKKLELMGYNVVDYSPVDKGLMWKEIAVSENLNNRDIVDILIKGSTRDIVDMAKNINNDNVDLDIKRLSNMLVIYERQNLDNMKKYI